MRTLHVASAFVLASLALADLARAQTTTKISVNAGGFEAVQESYSPSISADARYVAYISRSWNLVSGDTNFTNDIFLHDRVTGLVTRISQGVGGAQLNDHCFRSVISADGSTVAYESAANNVVAGDANSVSDVFVCDRATGVNERTSVASSGGDSNGQSVYPSLSGDGRFVAFESLASNLVANDTNGAADVFVRDRLLGVTTLASVTSGGAQKFFASEPGSSQCISRDGTRVVFQTINQFDPTDTNILRDIYVRDLSLGVTLRASIDSNGVPGNHHSLDASISSDGRYVAFVSDADNLVAADTNSSSDVFVRDIETSTTTCVSVTTAGNVANDDSHLPVFSSNGDWIAFTSEATNLVANDTNGWSDVFVRDWVAGTTELANVSTLGAQSNSSIHYLAVADDATIVFDSAATNLVAGVSNTKPDIYAHDPTFHAPVATYCTAKTNSLGCIPVIGASGAPSLSTFDAFVITASGTLNNKAGLWFWGSAPIGIAFQGGTLCVHAPTIRTSVQDSGGSSSGSDCSGSYSFHFDHAYMTSKSIVAGQTIYGQYWSRDPGFSPPDNTGLTDAITFTVAP